MDAYSALNSMGKKMAWKRFPVPEFDHRSLKGRNYSPPQILSKDEEDQIKSTALSGDETVAGAYAVEPDEALLDKLSFGGDYRQMIMCVLPSAGGHLLARSMAWFNQRVYILDGNNTHATVLYDWRTPRTHNTRLGPEEGIKVDQTVLYLLSGRILEGGHRGNRLMIDTDWSPSNGGNGYMVMAGCDKGGDNFHDSCFMLSWN